MFLNIFFSVILCHVLTPVSN